MLSVYLQNLQQGITALPGDVLLANYTQADLDAIKKAIVSGHKRVTVGGVTRENQSLDDLRALYAEINRQLTGAPRYRLVRTCKGL